MIKYVELTPPQSRVFRQAKIVSVECSEGSQVNEGDTLFRVKSGEQEIELPTTASGRIVEMIVDIGANITLSTALLLLETEVSESTATAPILEVTPTAEGAPDNTATIIDEKPTNKDSVKRKKQKKTKKSKKKHANKKKGRVKSAPTHEQQSLDLLGDELGKMAAAPPVKTPKELTQKSSTTMSAKPPTHSSQQITVPDIGADSAKVIEILVKVGDRVAKEDPLLTLESDKASMELPSSHAGVVLAINVELDQDVSEGTVVVELSLEGEDAADTSAASTTSVTNKPVTEEPTTSGQTVDNSESTNAQASGSEQVKVTIPDIGGDTAKVIEILVKVGQQVSIEDALVTLESDKASMDVPSSANGVIESIDVEIDQEVGEGTAVVTLLSETSSATQTAPEATAPAPSPAPQVPKPVTAATPAAPSHSASTPTSRPASKSHASPSVRRFARELGADLSQVKGSGRKGRISKDDVKSFVKSALNKGSATPSAQASSQGAGIPAVPAQDFTKFGEIDIQPLNRIKRLTAANLHRSWLNVPHVTHNDESNISDLESFRKQLNAENAKRNKGPKLSPLAFIVKAVVRGLQAYPQFNSSLEPGGENLIYKKYFHIGIAVETPNGLVVPVIRDADKKSVGQIATEMGELAAKARNGKLTMADMTGACMTISSLGGIGGTHFTPIVNAPEVAILGVSRSKMQPHWNGSEFEPVMMLPLSLSYDHRVIDGAEAARFTRHVADVLEDVRRLTI